MAENRKALTRDEIREIDRKAIEEYGIPGIILMENAGRNVAEEILNLIEVPHSSRVALICGKGNNGGDGYVIARHLYNKDVDVSVFLTTGIYNILSDGDAGINLQILLNMNVKIKELKNVHDMIAVGKELEEYDIIVDAIFGTGLRGEVREPIKTLIKKINETGLPVISVDIPSGLHCDEGTALGIAVKATKTVSFVAPKVGFFREGGKEYTGEVLVCDISVPKELIIPGD